MNAGTNNRGAGVVSLLIAAGVLLTCSRAGRAETPRPSATSAASLLRQALEAEATGNTAARTDYLRRALAADPGYAPAHWQAGDILVANRWLPIDQATQTAASKLDEYEHMCATAGDTVYDQFKVANFCAKFGMKSQERTHLENVLRLAPTSVEAGRRLGLVMHEGKFVSPGEIEALKEQRATQARAATKISTWRPRLEPLCKAIESDDPNRGDAAQKALHALADVDALPALEVLAAEGGVKTGTAIVATVSRMNEQAATESLVLHAIMAPHEEVRQAAIDALKPRSTYSYVPTLISGFSQPVDVHFETYSLADGRVGHRLSMFQEGEATKRSFVSEGTNTIVKRPGAKNGQAMRFIDDKFRAADARWGARVQGANPLREQTNQRIAVALRETVGEDLGADPQQWWQWWDRQNEVARVGEKPTEYFSRYTGGSVITYHHSCFVAGTPVWTPTGLSRIEEMREGDFVLSQNIETGELCYKQVMATTVGPTLRLVEIHSGDVTMRCTYGHLFWISGEGWRLAKDLKVGESLHTVHGPLVIDHVLHTGEASCHNLVVRDFGTYFVTDRAVLVHDVNLRGSTSATVPGLANPDPVRETPAADVSLRVTSPPSGQ